jgi:hypothetical protein
MYLVLQIASYIPLFDKYFDAYQIEFHSRWGLLIKTLPIFFLTLFYRKKILESDPNNQIFILSLFAQMALYIISFYVIWGFRVAYYLYGAQLVLASLILNSSKSKNKMKIILILYYLVIFFYNYVIQGQEGIFPYISIWG